MYKENMNNKTCNGNGKKEKNIQVINKVWKVNELWKMELLSDEQ